MRFSIGAKLGAGFLLIIALLGLSGWLAIRTLNTLGNSYTNLLTSDYPVALAAQGFNTEIQSQAQLTMAYAATRDDRLAEVRASRKRSDEHFQKLQAAADSDPELAKLLTSITDQRGRFNSMVDALFSNGGTLSNQALVFQADNVRAVGEMIGRQADQAVSVIRDGVDAKRRSVKASGDQATLILLGVILVSIVIALLVSFVVYRAVTGPLRTVTTELRSIAQGAGNLTSTIKVKSRDELGDLAESFNQLVGSLREMVQKVISSSQEIYRRSQDMRETTDSVAQASGGVSDSVAQVSTGAQQQAHQTMNATTIMGELNGAIGQIASGAQQQTSQMQHANILVTKMVQAMEDVAATTRNVAEASSDAASTATEGTRIVGQTLESMERMQQQVLGVAEKVTELGDHGSKIGEIMKVITEIADQTNLLALNAAIEAARAGEAGRGFAVVAEEVRKLAGRAGTSAHEIGRLIKNIQAGTKDAVTAIEEGTREVESSRKLAENAGNALVAIRQAVQRTSQGVVSISSAAQQVVGYSHEVARVVEEVAAITQENSAATEEMAAGADEVRQMIWSVSSVAEQNSAAVEEVSASILQVNASTENMAVAAQELTAIASELQNLVAQFKV